MAFTAEQVQQCMEAYRRRPLAATASRNRLPGSATPGPWDTGIGALRNVELVVHLGIQAPARGILLIPLDDGLLAPALPDLLPATTAALRNPNPPPAIPVPVAAKAPAYEATLQRLANPATPTAELQELLLGCIWMAELSLETYTNSGFPSRSIPLQDGDLPDSVRQALGRAVLEALPAPVRHAILKRLADRHPG